MDRETGCCGFALRASGGKERSIEMRRQRVFEKGCKSSPKFAGVAAIGWKPTASQRRVVVGITLMVR